MHIRAGVSMIRRRVFLSLLTTWIVPLTANAQAACEPPVVLGESKIAAILDARTLRLTDGREIRLAGIEILKSAEADGATWLRDHALHRTVTLRGTDETPDRYGRQHAFALIAGKRDTLQSALADAGFAVASGTVRDESCARELRSAESRAEKSKRGAWAQPDFVESGSKPSSILKHIGRFTLVEGTILSARQAGSTLYLNFGRRRIQGFAVTISRRMMPAFAAAGMNAATLEGRRIRVRGWIERHGGPRIEARAPGQIEFIDGKETAAAGDK